MGYGLSVDLGTTYTAAATIGDEPGSVPIMLSLGNRAFQIPSVLWLQTDGTFLVGEAAERRGAEDPRRCVREFKRRIGDDVPLIVAGSPFAAQALTGHLLKWVLDESAKRMGSAPTWVRLTHPANWGPFKLDVLRQAAALADLTDISLCPEPEAAALQYASTARVSTDDRLAVYDLGGGTFDACVLTKTDTGFQMIGESHGVEQLGGVDFDQAVFHHVLDVLDLSAEELDPTDAGVVRLRRDCVDAKEALSADVEASIPVSLNNRSIPVRLTRAELEDMIRPAIQATMDATNRALRSASLTAEELTTLVLVGGSSRIPLVTEMLATEFHRPIAHTTDPKHDVALGAARARIAQPNEADQAPSSPLEDGSQRASIRDRIAWVTAGPRGWLVAGAALTVALTILVAFWLSSRRDEADLNAVQTPANTTNSISQPLSSSSSHASSTSSPTLVAAPVVETFGVKDASEIVGQQVSCPVEEDAPTISLVWAAPAATTAWMMTDVVPTSSVAPPSKADPIPQLLPGGRLTALPVVFQCAADTHVYLLTVRGAGGTATTAATYVAERPAQPDTTSEEPPSTPQPTTREEPTTPRPETSPSGTTIVTDGAVSSPAASASGPPEGDNCEEFARQMADLEEQIVEKEADLAGQSQASIEVVLAEIADLQAQLEPIRAVSNAAGCGG